MNANHTAKLNSALTTYAKAHRATKSAAADFITSCKAAGIALDKDTLRDPITQGIAADYGVVLVLKDRGEGYTWATRMDSPDADTKAAQIKKCTKAAKEAGMTLAAHTTASHNACTCFTALMRDVFGPTAKSAETTDVPANVQALLDKAWALCVKADAKKAGKIMATAIANAKAAK